MIRSPIFACVVLLTFVGGAFAQSEIPRNELSRLRRGPPPARPTRPVQAGAQLPDIPQAGSPTNGVSRIVFEGESLTAGAPWADELAAAFPGAIKVNAATSADSAANMVNTFAAEITPHAPQPGQTSWFVLLAGVNDLYGNGALEVYQSLKNIWVKARESGFRVCAVTLADSRFISGYNPEVIRRERKKLNDLIRQDPTLYDALLPFDRWFTNAQDPVYFLSDQLHFTPAGSQALGKMAAAYFTSSVVNATAFTPEMVAPIVWQDNLKRLAAEYATTFQPMDLDRFTQIHRGEGTTFVPAYYGDYLITVTGEEGNAGGLIARYPTNTSANNIGWDTVTKRGIMLHARRYFGTQSAGLVRVLVGAAINSVSGPLDRTGFGFECRDSTDAQQIRAVAHNGSEITNGAWVPRFPGNTQWFAFCTNGVVTLWERHNLGADWSDWELLQTIGGGPTLQSGTESQMIRINAEIGNGRTDPSDIFVDIIQVAVTIGLDRPYDLGAR